MAVYDCFCFFNELDLLEIRLNILNDVVDKFVLVEATRTQKNTPKPLYFEENKERFKQFEDKIIHIIVDDYPEEIGMWTIENYQRNQIERGLKDCKDDDIIMISDLDEIPNPEELKKVFRMKELNDKIICLNCKIFSFYLNYCKVNYGDWFGIQVLTYNNFKNLINEKIEVENIDYNINKTTTASIIRYSQSYTKYKLNKDWFFYIKNKTSWHFTWLGGFDKYIQKHLGICEGHDNAKDNIEKSKKVYEILTKGGIYQQSEFHNKPIYHVYIKPDNFYPKYILDNINKYKHLFNHLDDKSLKSIKYYDSKFFNYFILKPKIFFCKYILSHPLIIKIISMFIFNKQKRKDFRYVMFRKYVNEDNFDKKNK